MRSATHYGECQLCGRQQKAPGSVMAKHGYTVEWGFFNGTCPGSGHLPFEKSKDQIDLRIPGVLKSVKEQQKVIDGLKAEPLPANKMMIRTYFTHGTKHGGRKGGYAWIETQIKEDSGDYLHPEPGRNQPPKWERGTTCGVESHRAQYTVRWIDTLEEQLKNTKRYLKWLETRAASWKLKDQAPVVAKKEIAAGDVVHLFGKDGFDVTVIRVEYMTARGCGPYMNGKYLPHIVYTRNGTERSYPVRLIRKPTA